ncbi:MAG TPA: APC family permease [Solirubrobacteraceae bacterium]|nr:APC family permease [Solirubrobacteraceae bacterium]
MSATGSRQQGGLRRDVGRIALLFTSVGSVIGSGWLLGSLNATQIAGPAALISWVVGAAAIMLLALIHAELGGMHAVNGGVARFPHYAFGSLVGYGTGWIYWLGSVTLAPVETEAAIQYADKWVHEAVGFHLMHTIKGPPTQVILSAPGYAVAAVLMLLFTVINLWGVRRLSETNRTVVWWKIAVPLIAIVALMVTSFSGSNFSAGDGFAPAGVKGILSAIATGGVVFAYLGFEQAIQFGGESRNPQRNIPFAVLGAMVVGVVIYVLLEVAFLGALSPGAAAHGWANLSFTNTYGPFAALASGLGLGWLAVILYIDAFISPAGTGLIYAGSSARVSYALSRNGYIPRRFGELSDRGVPWLSVIFAFVVGMIVFLPFPGWQKLVAFITSASVIIYAAQCLSLAAMRRQLPDHPRPFRLAAAEVIAPVGFVISNLIVLFAGWTTDWKLFVAIVIGLVLLAISQLSRPRQDRVSLDWWSSMWMWPWLVGLAILSWLSSFDGQNVLHFGVDMAVTAAFSLAVYFFALSRRLPDRVARERLESGADELEGLEGGQV